VTSVLLEWMLDGDEWCCIECVLTMCKTCSSDGRGEFFPASKIRSWWIVCTLRIVKAENAGMREVVGSVPRRVARRLCLWRAMPMKWARTS